MYANMPQKDKDLIFNLPFFLQYLLRQSQEFNEMYVKSENNHISVQ